MSKSIRLLSGLVALSLSIPASAQFSQQERESFDMASANTGAGPFNVFGGTYAFSQGCSAYGTITLQAQWPDGSWVTLVSKTAVDTAGTILYLGGGTAVRTTLTSTTGCAAKLQRIPR